MKTTQKELIWFLIPTFVITYGLGLIAYINGGLEHFPLLQLSMFVPAIIVIILYLFKFKKPIFKNNDLGINFKGLRYWIIVPLFVTLISSIGYLIPFIFDNDFFKTSEQILEITETTGLGVGHWFVNLIIVFGINTFISPVINIFLMLGEEIGWRAFLTPRLLKLYNPRIAFILSGTIWGVWHSAMIILGLNYPQCPIFGIFMMVFMCIPVSIIFQYFYFKSKSIFVAALAHGTLNWTANNFVMFLISNKDYNTFIYGPSGIIGIIFFSIVAYFLFKKVDWQKANTYSCFEDKKIKDSNE